MVGDLKMQGTIAKYHSVLKKNLNLLKKWIASVLEPDYPQTD